MRKVYLTLCIAISIGLVLFGVFALQISYIRLWESMKDFASSVAYFFCEKFDLNYSIEPTVVLRSTLFELGVPYSGTPTLVAMPEDWSGLWENVQVFFMLFFNGRYFKAWLIEFLIGVTTFVEVGTFVAIGGVVLFFLIRWIYRRPNVKHGKDTFALRAFKNISGVTYQPIKRFIFGFIEYVRDHEGFKTFWIFVAILSLNVGTIFMEVVAYYFYFLVEFDFISLWTQIVKLFQDVWVILYNFPWWTVGVVVWLFFDRWRKRSARDKLRHMNAINCGYIKSLPVVTLIVGLMGMGKTTVMCSMVANEEVMQRQEALDVLVTTDFKFPFFPWIKFEDELRGEIDGGRVCNLTMAGEWAYAKAARIKSEQDLDVELYGYDYKRYGLRFYDGLDVIDIFDALATYAKAYYVYIFDSSLIMANLSVRMDNYMIDQGNLPEWAYDLFHEGFGHSRHAHVMDFDAVRLGLKMIRDNPKHVEFGVVAITEIGKERGNNVELQGIKKTDAETNQKNDLFNSYLKMARHSATIDNRTFIKIFADEQRPESWGADARELAEVLRIVDMSDMQLAFPFYTVEDMLTEWLYNFVRGLYHSFRVIRGDNTLLIHILKGMTKALWQRDFRLKRRFGYRLATIDRESGTLDGRRERSTYFVILAQAYRFNTDCHSGFFQDFALQSGSGLADWPEFDADKASVEELLSMNSYFMNGLYGG